MAHDRATRRLGLSASWMGFGQVMKKNKLNNRKLEDRVALVTGAGRGIGKAIAIGFAREGATVVCTARTAAEIEEIVRYIENAGGAAIMVKTDVTDLESVDRLYTAIDEAYGRLDIVVVNAAANYEHGYIEGSNQDKWTKTIDVTLVGAYRTVHGAIPRLKARGSGKIIMIGSGLGHNGRPGSSAHACAKAGTWMLTRILAIELAESNISVNELIPGPVLTPGAQLYRERADKSVFAHSGEWIKKPEDVVPLAVFLASMPDRGPTAQSYSLLRRDI